MYAAIVALGEGGVYKMVQVCACACVYASEHARYCMLVRGCVGAWVRGCVGAWVRGCVDAWVRGCVGVGWCVYDSKLN